MSLPAAHPDGADGPAKADAADAPDAANAIDAGDAPYARGAADDPDNEAMVVARWLDGAHAAGFVRRVAQALRS